VAGVGVSVMQMGDSPGQSLQNIVVNVVLGGAVLAAFNFDTTVVQKKIKDKTRKDLQNPYLKGGEAGWLPPREGAGGEYPTGGASALWSVSLRSIAPTSAAKPSLQSVDFPLPLADSEFFFEKNKKMD
jgi:hypothetical protein